MRLADSRYGERAVSDLPDSLLGRRHTDVAGHSDRFTLKAVCVSHTSASTGAGGRIWHTCSIGRQSAYRVNA